MTLNFSAKISIDSGKNNKAIFESVRTDNKFYPENPTKTKIQLKDQIEISITSKQITHLRANINSTLRLVQASNDSIESVKI